ncbi:MAG: hypothetical protein J7J38_01270 [Candidatus Aenigmarchaeota archaeon]|nr:hypothetical protein [Candidatus Aenigmarchaeota archaeon]
MGNPTILFRKNLKQMWRCKNCGNMEEFKEDWAIEIMQDLNDKSQEINLVQSENIRCKKCGSHDVEEVRI